eukprot:1304864-Prymnesium_polylepis.1
MRARALGLWQSVNQDKLGEYQRKGYWFHDGRAVYECVDAPTRCIWYTTPYWYLGQVAGARPLRRA